MPWDPTKHRKVLFVGGEMTDEDVAVMAAFLRAEADGSDLPSASEPSTKRADVAGRFLVIDARERPADGDDLDGLEPTD